MSYDAILIVSFGGPESPEEVIPFLENVLRGRNVPRARMLAVAEHYYQFGGKSPINQQTRELIAALEAELERHGPKLPIYWGNRNWHPLLPETRSLNFCILSSMQSPIVEFFAGALGSICHHLQSLQSPHEVLIESALLRSTRHSSDRSTRVILP